MDGEIEVLTIVAAAVDAESQARATVVAALSFRPRLLRAAAIAAVAGIKVAGGIEVAEGIEAVLVEAVVVARLERRSSREHLLLVTTQSTQKLTNSFVQS